MNTLQDNVLNAVNLIMTGDRIEAYIAKHYLIENRDKDGYPSVAIYYQL